MNLDAMRSDTAPKQPKPKRPRLSAIRIAQGIGVAAATWLVASIAVSFAIGIAVIETGASDAAEHNLLRAATLLLLAVSAWCGWRFAHRAAS